MATIKTTDKPWDGASSRYPDADAFCAACLIDKNAPGQDKVKANCSLPIYEPDGTLNTNALGSAAAALAGARGGIQAPPTSKKAAAKKLLRLYQQLKRPIPATIKNMAQ